MHTIRLIYTSDAREDLRYRDFITIMDTAAETNRERAITGILCYGGGQFLQALEGERLAVNALYHHIATDPRHSNCQVLSVEEISTRDFAEWSMKIVDWNDAVTAARQTVLLKHSGSRHFDPANMSGQQASAFLREVAAMERLLTD
ncbi:BLUF domain-containing protein [Gemmatimonas groenlandica]|uniref:BLUF domain-containing protein n=1 Tax=Gemmatimonas groenlandica TaxID=2732249 RepID=A0A6M4IK40_9BACT|nr:BLUF domain-containing protein [Gemmatimonas groenlandica]QJR35000.1 BLUF domain-containing protein [Gemmatimonas groenlandica]